MQERCQRRDGAGRSVRAGVLLGALLAAPAPAPAADPAAAPQPVASARPASADYARVFPQDSVNRIDVHLGAEAWEAVRRDMTLLLGSDFGEPAAPAAARARGLVRLAARNPVYVPATVRFGGQEWRNVGFRLKGNSSLASSWRQGVQKLPFRLNLDALEDAFPEARDQTLHGFGEIGFSSGWADESLLREKLAADLFRMAGVPAARTAFYRVFVDVGEGPVYWGLYTAVEAIDDTFLPDWFGADGGNLYKPESRLAAFTPDEFPRTKGRGPVDHADVRALVAALNDPSRVADPPRWRAALEGTFDVPAFLRYLAVSNTIVNWDAYGALPHNYFLYRHPERGLTWIPWDHNMALWGGPGVTGEPATGFGGVAVAAGGEAVVVGRGLSLAMNEVGEDWPLLRYLADDPVYFARYREELRRFLEEVFTEERVEPLLERYRALIEPHVVGAEGERPSSTHLSAPSAFPDAIEGLRTHLRMRRLTASAFLGREDAGRP